MMNANEIFAALNNEQDLYDPQENELFVLDRNDKGRIYGVQVVHFAQKGAELAKLIRDFAEKHLLTIECGGPAPKRDWAMQFAFACIPAPGACCGSEHGYIEWDGFGPIDDDASEEDIRAIGDADLDDYAKSLVAEGTAARLVTGDDIPACIGF